MAYWRHREGHRPHPRDRAVAPRLRLVPAPAAPPRPRTGLRSVIATAGAVQMALGGAQIAGLHFVDTLGTTHLTNEFAAWNIAVGVAYLDVARRGRCPIGVAFMIGAFVAALTDLAVDDAIDGVISPARIATHTVVVVGFLLVLGLRRVRPAARPATGTD